MALREGDALGDRRVVLYKRWRLRDGVRIDDITTLVVDRIVPHYARLSGEVVLGLEVIDAARVLAIQRWPDRRTLDEAMAGEAFEEWWRDYTPSLADWDAVVELEEEWECEVLVG